jgi:hypothetical protein
MQNNHVCQSFDEAIQREHIKCINILMDKLHKHIQQENIPEQYIIKIKNIKQYIHEEKMKILLKNTNIKSTTNVNFCCQSFCEALNREHLECLSKYPKEIKKFIQSDTVKVLCCSKSIKNKCNICYGLLSTYEWYNYNTDKQIELCCTTLKQAVNKEHIDCMKLCFKYNIGIDISPDSDRRNILFYAVRAQGNCKVVEVLLNNNVPQLVDRFGTCPQNEARLYGHTKLLNLLIKMS